MNTKLTAIIVDDEQKSRQTLTQMVTKYCQQVTLLGESGNIEEAFDQIHQHNPDLVFLDISMPGGDGFELLKRFPEPGFDVIFITAFDQYAIQAIRLCALDYLLKPVNIQELVNAVHRAGEKKKDSTSPDNLNQLLGNLRQASVGFQRIHIPSRDGIEFIEVNHIIRLEADGSYTRIFLNTGKKMMSTRYLKEYEDLLPKNLFFRAHHSHIINLDHIRQYHKGEGGHVVMSDGSVVDISKRKKKEFMDRLSL